MRTLLYTSMLSGLGVIGIHHYNVAIPSALVVLFASVASGFIMEHNSKKGHN